MALLISAIHVIRLSLLYKMPNGVVSEKKFVSVYKAMLNAQK
jgi:hypothetical protein